jgi:arginine utilization protein RocB
MLKNVQKENELRSLTQTLVSFNSVVNSNGEKVLADKIYEILSGFEVFKNHPECLRMCPVKDDPLQRFSILALVKKPDVSDTLLGIGHFDTVGIEDYGDLKSYALDSEELPVQMKKNMADSEVLRDLADPDYLFGRGALDMKSGIAIWLTLLHDVSLTDFNKNLLVCFVCDEEGNSKGMIDAIPHIQQMKDDFDLDIQSAVDTDYSSPQYPGDTRRFLYGGTIGKLLVQYLCIGKEAHAGDPYAGVDANHLVSALIEEINMNPMYCDKNDIDVTVPPITLTVKDDKQQYSVQTAKTASVAFNVTTIGRSIEQWEEMFIKAGQKAMGHVIDRLNTSYRDYTGMKGIDYVPLPWKVNVTSFQMDSTVNLMLEVQEDERDFSLRWVKQQFNSDQKPQIVLFLSMPYYPHHTLDTNNPKHQQFISDIQRCAPDYTFLPYYPYISDLSFVSRANPMDVSAIRRLIPGYDKLNRMNWSALDSLDIPMINVGPWGKDAHKLTERVFVPSIYSVYEILYNYLLKVNYQTK